MKIKIALLMTALGSALYWAGPPYQSGGAMMAAWSVLWALVALAAFRSCKAEDWGYRLGSFLGVALATVEGTAWLLGLDQRQGLWAMALLHGAAFVFSLVGRYQKAGVRAYKA